MKALKCPGCWHIVAKHTPRGCRALRMVSSGNYQARKVLCGCKLKQVQARRDAVR
jgi:hypothetical protein